MDVENFLSAVFADTVKELITVYVAGFRDVASFANHVADQFFVFRREVSDCWDVLFWNYEKVGLCGRMNIRKNHTKIVFIFDCCGDFFVGYFTKDAILGHWMRVT